MPKIKGWDKLTKNTWRNKDLTLQVTPTLPSGYGGGYIVTAKMGWVWPAEEFYEITHGESFVSEQEAVNATIAWMRRHPRG